MDAEALTPFQRLNDRTECRKTFDEFAHTTFDKAFQLGCISSDESEDADTDPFEAATAPKPGLVSHPLAWRSRRLERFYELLDEAALLRPNSSASRPRGPDKRERRRGAPKTAMRNSKGIIMPPKSLPSWMISKRWRREATATLTHTRKLLPQMINEDSNTDFDWSAFDLLGNESEEEEAGPAGPSSRTLDLVNDVQPPNNPTNLM
jgi:hypothetical protein